MNYTLIPEQSPVVGVHVDGVLKGWIYSKPRAVQWKPHELSWFFKRVGEEAWTGPLPTERTAVKRCLARPLGAG